MGNRFSLTKTERYRRDLEMARLYQDEWWSTEELSREFDITPGYVGTLLRNVGVELRKGKSRLPNVRKYLAKHPEDAELESHALIRRVLIDMLGGKCTWGDCNVDDHRMLQIDHIVPIKNSKRRSTRWYGPVKTGNTEGLQLLCANHHSLKSHQNNEYRHTEVVHE